MTNLGAKPVGAGDLDERPLSGRKRTMPFDGSAVPYAPILLKKSPLDKFRPIRGIMI